MAKRALAALTMAPVVALVGCGSSDDKDLPTEPPTQVTQVASGGFQSPTDAVASPDGKTFYFAAYDELNEPTIYRVASMPGSTPEVPVHSAVNRPSRQEVSDPSNVLNHSVPIASTARFSTRA